MTHAGLLQRIASEEALWTAWDEVCLARGAPGVDGVSVKAFGRDAAAEIRWLAEEIPARRYRPSPSPPCATALPRRRIAVR